MSGLRERMTWTAEDVVRLPPRAEARAAAAVSDGHSTSAMVALLPDGDTSWCLQTLPHVTLVYAGQVDDAAPGTRERLEQACADLALAHAPMTVPVTGVDTFGREERVDVLTLATDRLATLRSAVEWANASEFIEFKPHATVGPEGSAASIDVPATLTFSRLVLSWGHDDVTWFLVGGQTRSRPLNAFAPMAPELRSRIFREYRVAGKGGQFAKGGGRVPGRGGAAPAGGSRSLTPDEVADFMGPSGTSIRPHLVPDGQGGYKISAERHAMHEAFIADQLRGATPVDSPTTTILGGGPASGKSTAATLAGVPGPVDKGGPAVWADPDAAKHAIPGFDPKTPGPVHEESSYMAKELSLRAHEASVHVVIDGCGDNPRSVASKVAVARAHGSAVRGVYVTTSITQAQARNASRARSVAPRMLEAKHKAVSKNFGAITRLSGMDSVELWLNPDGQAPRLIASASGGKVTRHSKADYAMFVLQGH